MGGPEIANQDLTFIRQLARQLAAARARHPGTRFESLTDLWEVAAQLDMPIGWREIEAMVGLLRRPVAEVPPVHVVEFISAFLSILSWGRYVLLDPWEDTPVLLPGVVDLCDVDAATAFGREGEIWELSAKASPTSSIEWRRGDPFELLRSLPETVDAIVCAPPLGLRRQLSGRGSADHREPQDVGNALLLRSIDVLSDSGLAIFLMPESFHWHPDGQLTQQLLAAKGFYVSAAISVAEAGRRSSVPLNLLVVDKHERDDIFVGRLTPSMDHEQLAENLFGVEPEGDAVELGRWVKKDSFTGWGRFVGGLALQKALDTSPFDVVRLTDVAKTIRRLNVVPGDPPERAPNAVYMPEIVSRVVSTSPPSATGHTPRRVYEISLDPDLASADYVVGWLETEVGDLLREGLAQGGTIKRIQLKALKEAVIPLPPIADQLSIVDMDQRLRTAAADANQLRDKLWHQPDRRQLIAEAVEQLSAKDGVEDWMDTLPFPLASIVYRSLAEADPRERFDRLLHFFEATAEFCATVLLSAIRGDESLYTLEREKLTRPDPTGRSSLARSSFASWTQMGQTLAKTVRRLANDTATRDAAAELFGVSSPTLGETLSSKPLWAILDDAREIRNRNAHGGGTSSAQRSRLLDELTTLLTRLRETTASTFSGIELVQPGGMTFRHGIYSFAAARQLTGPNAIFRRRILQTLLPLEADDLYIVDRHGTVAQALRVLPFFKLLPAPDSEATAIYFFNSAEPDGTQRFVSYHFEGEPETTLADPALRALLSDLSPAGSGS
jgi:hypothetical protein